jgi:hypothetical protein
MRLLRLTSCLIVIGMVLIAATTPRVLSARAAAIGQPQLISPNNNVVMDNGCGDKSNGITWDFDWSDVPRAEAYHIRVWKNPAIPVINEMNVTASNFHYDSPQTYIINTNLTGWRWTVRAKVHGVWGPWAPARYFRVERLNTDCP